jgi:excisionase family DNA binding protein
LNTAELAASFAIFAAKQRASEEVTPDDLLIGSLRAISRFGIASIGPWDLDLEALGVDWMLQPDGIQPKVTYSQEAVGIFDRAAQIAKSTGDRIVGVNHLLAAFASEETVVMGELKRKHGITSASWRAAVAQIGRDELSDDKPPRSPDPVKGEREYLTPEEAAQLLGIHVQTMRSYIRTARVPAFRMAGERAIRIRRSDLDKILEPLETEKGEE